MRVFNEKPFGKYSLAVVDEIPIEILRDHAAKYLNNEYPIVPKTFGVTADAAEKLQRLKDNLKTQYSLQAVARLGDEIVGWTQGWQDSVEPDSFFMGASLVRPEYRRQGLYSALLDLVLEVTESEGFQSVWSLHTVTNNAILIAKLKRNFFLYGIEVNTRYGALARLVFHHNGARRRALEFRAGAVDRDDVLKALKSES